MKAEFTSWHVAVAAEAIAAALFARCGYDVSVQYGANQPEYDLIVAKGEQLLKVSVKGSQDGGWGLCQSYLTPTKADYHDAIARWLARHKPRTVLCFVQFPRRRAVRVTARVRRHSPGGCATVTRVSKGAGRHDPVRAPPLGAEGSRCRHGRGDPRSVEVLRSTNRRALRCGLTGK